jgi:hypothetical protein
MNLDTHIYFVPASHLHQNLLSSRSWMQLGDCIVHVRPSDPDSDLYAVILGCYKATPSFERRQALRALVKEEASTMIHPGDPVSSMIHDLELPSEGPAPLLSLSQLMRQNPKDWYEIYEGKVKRIKCKSLLCDLNAVSVRADDSKDVTVEYLLSAPGSREHQGSTHFTQFGAFAARDLPACAICASYSRGATMSPTEAVKSSLDLREFDFEVLLSQSDSLLITGNPLVNSAAMVNDARGSNREPNAELFVALVVSIDGSRELHVMLQTTQQIKAGAEILIEYGATFWRAWARQRGAMKMARERVLIDSLITPGC